MMVKCSECGEPSDRGTVRRCRGCSPLVPIKYLGVGGCGLVVRAYRVSDADEVLWSIADLHRATRRIRERRKALKGTE